MPLIGRQLNAYSDRVVLDSLTASATADYTLQLNGSNFVPSSAESLTVSLNGVIQKPQDSYTVSSSTLSFNSALTASDSIDFVIAERGITLQTPSAGSVNTEQLANGAVSLAKLSATGTKDSTTFLRGDNTFAEAGGGITNVQSFVISGSDLATSGSGYIQSNIATNDQSSYSNVGSIVSQSSGTFSFSQTGYYLVSFNLSAQFTVSGSQDTGTFEILTTVDNSTYVSSARVFKFFDHAENVTDSFHLEAFVNVDDTSNVKVRFGYGNGNSWDGIQIYGSFSDYERTQMNFIRLGDSV